jgi:hypothetical protein
MEYARVARSFNICCSNASTGDPATKVLENGLGALAAVCEHINESFDAELAAFEAKNPS